MAVETGRWRIGDSAPRRLEASLLPSEATLQNYLEKDPSLLGMPLIVIGRQMCNSHGRP
ncbi:MAG: hypothetical protein L0H96_19400 [Humibacillus sp.]|nr:hypothetical protein [Humibacillus sp.]MDN5779065.1 hypothetical protein [Humibacillus sp.]